MRMHFNSTQSASRLARLPTFLPSRRLPALSDPFSPQCQFLHLSLIFNANFSRIHIGSFALIVGGTGPAEVPFPTPLTMLASRLGLVQTKKIDLTVPSTGGVKISALLELKQPDSKECAVVVHGGLDNKKAPIIRALADGLPYNVVTFVGSMRRRGARRRHR